MSTTDLTATRNGPARELAPADVSPIDALPLLDVYAGGVSNEAPRPEWLATISAGELITDKAGKTYPRSSRDGTIFLHDPEGRAPGLKERLEENEYKRLTITFPWNNPSAFIQQRFERRSATKLEAYGDQHAIRALSDKGQSVYEAGTEEYAAQVARCKVVVSVLFTAAAWTPYGPEVQFLDGLGSFYRLRFTSRNSLRSIVNTLRQVGRFTQGRLAGIPFDLSLDYRDVADGTGTKRHVCVWVLNMRPPGTLKLTSRNFAAVMTGALDQGDALMLRALPAPSQETLEMAELEAPALDLDEVEIDDADAELLQRGGRCDAKFYEKLWFAAVNGSDLDSDERRAEFLRWYTSDQFDSLARFLEQATEAEATALLNEVAEYVLDRKKDERAPVVLPSAVATGTLTRNDFIIGAIEKFGYDGRMEIARALGLVTLNAWLTNGRTWKDAWAKLERIEAAKEAERQAEDRANEAGDADESEINPLTGQANDPTIEVEEPDGEWHTGMPDPDEDDRPTGMAEDDAAEQLLGLWSDYQSMRATAQANRVKLPPQPPMLATAEEIKAATAEIGTLIEKAQRQSSFVR